MFNNSFFLQVTGASMGAKFSPSLANIYMCWWEREILFAPCNPYSEHLLWYGSYINDLLFIWGSDVAAVPGFMEFLNSNDLNHRFTGSYHHDEFDFLDLHLRGDRGSYRVISTTFRKKTSVNSILHATSCHPPHVVKNLPVGEMIRACRNCSLEPDFSREAVAVGNRLRQRGYPNLTIMRAIKIAAEKNRNELIKTQNTKSLSDETSKPIIFSTQYYSTEFRSVQKIIDKHMPILHTDPGVREALESGYMCVSRRAPTLGQMLSPSLFTDGPTKKPTWLKHTGSYKCCANRCVCCSYIHNSNTFVSCSNKDSFVIKQYINCSTSGVIYLFTCHDCNLQYIGCTTNPLKITFPESSAGRIFFSHLPAGAESTCTACEGELIRTLLTSSVVCSS
ncbi:uncharacterized protein LOC130284359 [Hyla sarda]|uniref:uncharacterized protein LOC130284359 n=1 Tax=Hyla sarda TaxID=327740 RepID=UPI0024C403D3|nr:uncharacterized protein LOC130284359 [Hyla sarda]